MSREGHVRRLNKASTVFFVSGAVASKLQLIPVLFLPAICYIFSSFSYLIAFGLWIIANNLAPKNPRKKDAWYGFAQFKNQYIFSAVVGTCAIALSLVGIFFPVALVLAGWLYVLSQSLWIVAEYHKLKSPPINDPKHSSSRQSAYLRMTVFLALIGLITATATTLAFFFPPLAMPIFLCATILCLTVNLGAVEAWLSYQFDPHVPDIIEYTPNELAPEEEQSPLPLVKHSNQDPANECSKQNSPRRSLHFFPLPQKESEPVVPRSFVSEVKM